ncbi:MAG TPA: NPCBM/NEW2 domain-containing protein [Actinocrinis sp.]|nr:NPCBM/NEW2 domain-containing protein [Actinocrinis sp.]
MVIVGGAGFVIARQNPSPGPPVGAESLPTSGGAATTEPEGGAGLVFLSDLVPVSGEFLSEDTLPSIEGRFRPDAIAQDLGCVPSGQVTYDLGGQYSDFDGLLGIDVQGGPAISGPTVKILGDDEVLATFAPTSATSDTFSITVSAVSQLTIEWSYPIPSSTQGSATCTPVGALVVDGALG